MTREALKALSDAELEQVGVWALEETRERLERRRQETIYKIKEMAGAVGVTVTIGGVRGRPPKKTGKEPKRSFARASQPNIPQSKATGLL